MEAIERVLGLYARLDPDPAARARRSLHRICEGIQASVWPDVAWQFSALNGDGYPVEFVFSSADSAVRYTAEVAPPEFNQQERLCRAASLCEQLGGVRVNRDWLRRMKKMQSEISLRYGCWLGGRHDAAGDRYKIYVESRCEALRCIGFDPRTECTEEYHSLGIMRVDELGRRLITANLRDLYWPLLKTIGSVLDRPLRDELPGGNYGCSVAGTRDGRAMAFSVFTFARIPLGSDGAIRRRLLPVLKDPYAAATQHLQNTETILGMHGVISFIGVPGRPVEVRVGVRP